MVAHRVKLADVARLARVSPTTVSRVLSNDPRISVRTRQVVLHAANQLGYVPDARASSLRKQMTRTLGLLIPDVADPMHSQVAMAFEQEAARCGYTVLLANGFNEPAHEQRALQVFAAQRTDGIAAVGSILSPEETRSVTAFSHVVFVASENPQLAGRQMSLPHGAIWADDAGGMEAVVHHLLDRGYRKIAYISGPDLASNITRRDAVVRTLAQAGLAAAIYQYFGGIEHWTAGAAVAPAVWQDQPEALVCYDDLVALGTMDALRAQGIHVPDDVAIVGFDDIPFAALANPRLTTVAQPADELGRQAVSMVHTAITQGELPPSRTLSVCLTVRESTGRIDCKHRSAD